MQRLHCLPLSPPLSLNAPTPNPKRPPTTNHLRKQVTASLAKFAQVAGVAASSLLLAAAANAATIKLGADSGALVFDPAVLTVGVGEEITFINNAGYPHNVLFDEDEIPTGVDGE